LANMSPEQMVEKVRQNILKYTKNHLNVKDSISEEEMQRILEGYLRGNISVSKLSETQFEVTLTPEEGETWTEEKLKQILNTLGLEEKGCSQDSENV